MDTTLNQITQYGTMTKQLDSIPVMSHTINVSSSENLPCLQRSLKIVLAGAPGAGKTSLAYCFTGRSFSDKTSSTIGIEFTQRVIDCLGQRVSLQLWDTPGNVEAATSIFPNFFRFADAVLLVYDVTDLNSVKQIPSWLNLTWEHADPGTPIFIAGTKGDQDFVREVCEMAKDIADKEDLRLMYSVSAKTGFGVDELFNIIVEKLVDSFHAESTENIKLTKSKKTNSCCKCS